MSTSNNTTTTTASGVPVRVVPNGWRPKEDCLTLAVDELAWLDQFREQLLEQYPGLVEDIIVYGSRARGMGNMGLELNVLVLIREGYRAFKKEIARAWSDLAMCTYTPYRGSRHPPGRKEQVGQSRLNS